MALSLRENLYLYPYDTQLNELDFSLTNYTHTYLKLSNKLSKTDILVRPKDIMIILQELHRKIYPEYLTNTVDKEDKNFSLELFLDGYVKYLEDMFLDIVGTMDRFIDEEIKKTNNPELIGLLYKYQSSFNGVITAIIESEKERIINGKNKKTISLKEKIKIKIVRILEIIF